MGLEFEGIDVYLNLAVSAPVRLRHRRALDVGYLVAHLKLRDVFELRFVKALAFQRNQANRLAGASIPSTTGGNVPGGRRRKSAIARLAMLLSAAFGSVPGLK